MEDKKEKKIKASISSKTAVKGLINGFIAYGILILFIFFTLSIIIAWTINNAKNAIDYDTLKYSLPILAAFLIFYLIRAVCRLSTFDLFKKCKLNKEYIDDVSSKMNLFFIGCILFFLVLIIFTLSTRFNNQLKLIQHDSNDYYESFNEDYANYLSEKAYNDYETQKSDTIIQTIIIEIGLLFGIFSLIPTQKKYIELYNEE